MKLTAVQKEQLAKAQAILGEHFDHYTMFVGTDRYEADQHLIDCTARFRGPTNFIKASINTLVEVLNRQKREP